MSAPEHGNAEPSHAQGLGRRSAGMQEVWRQSPPLSPCRTPWITRVVAYVAAVAKGREYLPHINEVMVIEELVQVGNK